MRSTVLLLGVVFLTACESRSPAPPAILLTPSEVASLDGELELLRQTHHVPALAAAVTRAGGEIARGAAGVRRLGGDEPVAASDAFHIGSVTKPFTATLAGQLVAAGRLRWETTVGEAFPAWRAEIRPEYLDVSLAELLSHEGGIPPFTEDDEFAGLAFAGTAREQRAAFARHVLGMAPAGPRGSFLYSNAGFSVVAVMLEQVADASWEDLVRLRILDPLQLTSAGFGWPAKGREHAVWGHLAEGGAITPHDPAGEYQLPPTIAPAGDLAMSMPDLAAFLREHLRALRGESALLPRSAAAVMHTRRSRGGLGFGVQKVGEIEPVSTYSGSADTFYCVIAVAPRHDVAVAVAANAADEAAAAAVKEALKSLLARYATVPGQP